jgi:DNA primase
MLLYDRYIPEFGMEYLLSRGISDSSISKWELGWDAKERRIVIPVHDSRGRVCLLIRRAVRAKDHPKYLYTEGVARNALLYGTGQIDLGMIRSDGIVLVEGSIDTIFQHQDGYTNTVGILGSKLSEIQAKQIANMRPARVISMFDADGAGISATISASARLRRVPFYVVRFPRGKTDPAELTKKERDRVIDRAIPVSEFRKRVRHLTRSTKEATHFG